MIICVSFFVCLLYVALVNAKSNRIVGGIDADPGQFKYQVILQDDQGGMCGAAIIGDKYVLTAAHCVIDDNDVFKMSRYHVVAGSTNVNTNEGVRINVEKIYVPSRYRTLGRRNDIAVLKLRRSFGLDSNPNLQKVNLPSNRVLCVGHPAIISGYGLTYVAVRFNEATRQLEEYDGYTDGKLRYAVALIIANGECSRKNDNYEIDDNQICSQAIQHRGRLTGICSGDSGGPLVSSNVIIGVASVSPTGCMENRRPAIYTKVSSFVGFIENAMKDTVGNDMVVYEIPKGESSSGRKKHEKSTRDRPFLCD